ncbi:hypothetical protein SDC9_92257 [bioreactor metagenome]|uniref:Uncharacterized protein n=1 Tax=bioreactor metagenome TaxID=1076179 RepID=A0A644ZX76_9ZZZZ
MQHGHDGGLAVHQFLHLEALHVGHAQPVMVSIQQLAVCAAQHVRRERLAQGIRLQQYRQARHRALFHRRTGETAERGPDSGLLFGADGHALMPQPAFDPFGRPGAVAFAVDACQGLEGDLSIHTQVVVLTTQPENGGSHRAPHVEGKDARAAIAPKLHRQGGEQHRLAHAGRPSHQCVPHVADMRHQPEWRRALGARDDQRRAIEVGIALRAGPYRRHRHQVCQVQRRDDGLAHVRVGVAWDGRQPGIDRVERFGDGDEAPALDDALHHAQLLVGLRRVGIEYRHRGGDIAEGHLIAAQLLQGSIRIGGLVAGIRVHQRGFLLEDGFAQQRDDVLALGEPLAAQAGEFFFRIGFVEAEKTRTPAVGKAEAVEVVQNPRPGRGRKTAHRRHAQVLVAQHGCQPANERGIGQQRVEVEWHLGYAHAVAPRGDGRVQVRQCLAVIEPRNLRHHAIEQVEDAIRLRDEGGQALTPIHAFGRAVLVQHPCCAGTGLLRRQVHQRQVIAALEVVARVLESGPAFLVHQPRQRLGKLRVRVVGGGSALGLDEQGPARTQAPQRVVQPRRRGDQLALRRAVEVGPTETRSALEAAVLVQDDARRHQASPRQPVSEQGRPLAVFGKVQHGGIPLHVQQWPVLDVAGEDLHELRIDAGAPDRQRMADDPEHDAWNPHLQAQAHGSGQGAVGDGHGARGAAHQDRFGQ